MKNPTKAERTSDREVVAWRTINGPARLVFEAWTKAELFARWWVPKSFPVVLASCEIDARVDGRYRLVFGTEPAQQMAFFGRYLEVVPASRLVWTNEEDPAGGAITSVTFEEHGEQTRVTVLERYPSKEALDAAIASGSVGLDAMPESLQQLDELISAAR